MMHKARSSIEEVPLCLPRSPIKFQVHTALKIVEFDPNWAFSDSNSSFNTPMAAKRCNVRPSVRPRFQDFSRTCFEISMGNLVYTFSRWQDMSSLSCITIGSLWPSLQPKVSQTHFLQSWPHKSRYILQIWYTGGLLYTSRHKFCL